MVPEGLFGELGYRPKPGDAIDDRGGVPLSGGMAIGLVSLGLGSSAFQTLSMLVGSNSKPVIYRWHGQY